MKKGICPLCRRSMDLLIHHISYIPEKTIEICKGCHWGIHPAPKHCPMRTDSITITDTCLISCQKAYDPYNRDPNQDACPYHFRTKYKGCPDPGSNSELRKARRKQGLCEWHAATCQGEITKCPKCGFSYCDYHRHWLLDTD
jgi:hypothetical protein